jgi:hypothetical protein
LNSFVLRSGEGVDLVAGQQVFGDAPSDIVRVWFDESHAELETGGGQDAGERGDRRRATP